MAQEDRTRKEKDKRWRRVHSKKYRRLHLRFKTFPEKRRYDKGIRSRDMGLGLPGDRKAAGHLAGLTIVKGEKLFLLEIVMCSFEWVGFIFLRQKFFLP